MASVKIQLKLKKGDTSSDATITAAVMDKVRANMEKAGVKQPQLFSMWGDYWYHTVAIGYQSNAQRDIIRQTFIDAGHEIL